MNGAFAQARTYGVTIRFADLGDWGRHELRAEYDPAIPEIRINLRLAAKLKLDDLAKFVTLAIGHELYHHRERIGEIAVLADRDAREAAAADFAHELLEQSS